MEYMREGEKRERGGRTFRPEQRIRLFPFLHPLHSSSIHLHPEISYYPLSTATKLDPSTQPEHHVISPDRPTSGKQ